MKKLLLYTILLISISSFNLNAQRNCGTLDMMEIEEEHPEQAAQLKEIEKQTNNWIQQLNENKSAAGIITIPVVFHVIHTGTISTVNNIPDAYLLAQLDQLTDDFRRMNSDLDNVWNQADDTEIEFCLATTDPNGSATNGIVRHLYSTGTWSRGNIEGSIKPSTIWNRNSYLNIWVIPNPTTDSGGGLLGYAQFPGGAANTDGVVIKTSSTGSITTPNPSGGSYNIGRTGTHEVGHWLNLRHIWGDGPCGADDFVGDTPESDNPNFGCSIGHVSCGSTDMVQNYMDYSFDNCMNLMTTGQKNRMQALFGTGGFRASLMNSQGCISACPQNQTIVSTFPSGSNLEFEVSNTITASNDINSGANVEYDAGVRVRLIPGFHAKSGSTFRAFIDGCGGAMPDGQHNNEVDKEETNFAEKKSTSTLNQSFTLNTFPNPFSDQTTIAYNLPQDAEVTLVLTNLTGKTVKIIEQSTNKLAGEHNLILDGSNMENGIYYLTIYTGDALKTQKLILSR